MFDRIIHFIKYNNVAVLVILAVFLLSAGAFASETGREIIGGKQTSVEGVDNTLLLEADLDKLDMEFKIEKIEEDGKLYYVTYTYLDLAEANGAWRYQIKENTRLVSKKLKKDLGQYLAEQFSQEYGSRIKELKEAKEKAQEQGETKRVEVAEYTGLIGQALDAAARVFPDYEPVKKTELAAPMSEALLSRLAGDNAGRVLGQAEADDLTKVYNDFISENDPDKDNILYFDDNCPTIYNPDQLDSDLDGVGDVCDIDNMATERAANNSTSTSSAVDSGYEADSSQTANSNPEHSGQIPNNPEDQGTGQDNQEVEVINPVETNSDSETNPFGGQAGPAELQGAGPEPSEQTQINVVPESQDEPNSIFGTGETEMVSE